MNILQSAIKSILSLFLCLIIIQGLSMNVFAQNAVTSPQGDVIEPKAITTNALAAAPEGFRDTTVFKGLTYPTVVRFAKDGRVFIAEKSGLIKVFDSIVDTTPDVFADLRPEVMDYWDRGLLGMALDPNFPTSPYIYVLYTVDAPIGQNPPIYNDACADPTGAGCVVSGKLARITANNNAMVPGSEISLIRDWCQQFPSHTVGNLDFGPDGALYVSGGDGADFNRMDYGQFGNPCNDPVNEGGALRSQDLQTSSDVTQLNGTILRVNPANGNALTTNPLYGGRTDDDRIIAYGMRNPFRFTFNPLDSSIFVGDVGWGAWEEIDRISNPSDAIVENFGWPCYEGMNKQDAYDAANLPICENLYTNNTVSSPYYTYDHGTSASITGVAFYNATAYPAAYKGALFFADYSLGWLKVMKPNIVTGLPDPTNIETFTTGANIIYVTAGLNGDIFYSDFIKGEIHRIDYSAGNRPPAAKFTSNKSFGTLPLNVTFDGSGSSDPDTGDVISYSWDLNGDGIFGDSTVQKPSYTYTSKKNYTVSLRVTDNKGASHTVNSIISAGDRPPTAIITTPTTGTTFKVGDTISYSGRATDPDSETINASQLSWSIILYHCSVNTPTDCHQHQTQNKTGVTSGSFQAPDHEYPSYLEISLTATDAQGLTNTQKITLNPQTATLTILSNPTGLKVTEYGAPVTTSYSRQVIANASVSVSAVTPQMVNGSEFTFSNWSDNGAQTHAVTVPPSGLTITANYTGATPIQRSWNSYNVSPQAGSPQGVVRDGNNTYPAQLEFYTSTNTNGVDKGTLFTMYNVGENPDLNNKVNQYWANETGTSYTYVGKSTVNRGSDTGESNTPSPAGVKDLQIHPSNTDNLTVAAFTVPVAGDFTITNLAARRVDSNTGQSSTVKVFNSQKQQIATVKATSTAWTTNNTTYSLGTLRPGDKIYFAVDRDSAYWWDMTELSWSINLLGTTQAIPTQITTNIAGIKGIIDGKTVTMPSTLSTTATTHTVYAPSPQTTADGKTVMFSNWSDGGAQLHTVNSINEGTVTAIYTVVPTITPLFKNGFEEGNTSAYPQGNIDIAAGNTLQVKNTNPRSGTYSLEVSSDGSGPVTQAVIDQVPAKTNTIYVQTHINVSALTLNPGQAMNIIALKNENYRRLFYITIDSDYRIKPLFFDPKDQGYCEPDICGKGISYGSFGPAIPRDSSWHEIQLRYTVDQAHGQVEIWLDGAKIAELYELNTGVADVDAINVVSWGTFYSSLGVKQRMYFDDMAISNQYLSPVPATPTPKAVTWNSYDVTSQAGNPQGIVKDTDGANQAALEFYTSTNTNGVDKGSLFTTFNAAENPDLNNRVNQYWANETGASYTYIGKSTTNRGADTNETNPPAPTGVKDLQIHPSNTDNLTVAAFIAPTSGAYSVTNLAARRVDSNAGQSSTLKVFNSQKQQIATVNTTSNAWATNAQTYSLGNLQAGDRVYFAVDRDGGYWWDMTEVAWSIRKN